MSARTRPTLSEPPPKTIVIIGLMGAGKSSIGRRLATRLQLPFVDADREIEDAAGCSIADFFERYGEAAFRDGERRVIDRLLRRPVHVLATGGGSFMNPGTRHAIRERGIAVWLRAELEVLVRRTARRSHRPLLNSGNPREILAGLIAQRYPVYAEADVIVDSQDIPPEDTVDRVINALARFLSEQGERPGDMERTAPG